MLKWKNAKEVLQEFTRKKYKTGLEKMSPSSWCCFSGIFGGISAGTDQDRQPYANIWARPFGLGGPALAELEAR